MKNLLRMLLLSSAAVLGHAHAGPYVSGTAAEPLLPVDEDSGDIVGWASGVASFTPGPAGLTDFQIAGNALGVANATSLSASESIANLGRGGRIVLTFDAPIVDGPGADFAVFENGFSVPTLGDFLELASVEVSSDGTNFFPFPRFSWTVAPLGEFGYVDPTDISGLAGKYVAGQGTPFDLSIFAGASGIDINGITHVAIIDLIGDGSETDDSPVHPLVACGTGSCPIYDPYAPTLNGANGFDLDAVAVLNQGAASIPLPASFYFFVTALALLSARGRTDG